MTKPQNDSHVVETDGTYATVSHDFFDILSNRFVYLRFVGLSPCVGTEKPWQVDRILEVLGESEHGQGIAALRKSYIQTRREFEYGYPKWIEHPHLYDSTFVPRKSPVFLGFRI